MPIADVLPYLTGAGGAIAALTLGIYLLISGRLVPRGLHDEIVGQKDRQITDLTIARDKERERADAAVLAAQTTRDVLVALHKEASAR